MRNFSAKICLLAITLTVVACKGKSKNLIKPTDKSTLEMTSDLSRTEESSACKNRILFLPQTHPSILGGSLEIAPENFEKTLRSQFSIAKYLEKNQGIPVFSEQVASDMTVETVSAEFKQTAAQVKTMFPNGLPESLEALTEEQRTVVARAGGDAISFILRNTDKLHRVVENDQIQNQLINQVSEYVQNNPYATSYSPEIYNIIFNVREKLALEQINKYLLSHPSQRDVILIYGSDHSYSFLNHPEKFPSKCILVPNEFRSAMTSPYSQ